MVAKNNFVGYYLPTGELLELGWDSVQVRKRSCGSERNLTTVVLAIIHVVFQSSKQHNSMISTLFSDITTSITD